MINVVSISLHDKHRLEDFIGGLNSELQTFRYYDKRDSSVIANHIETCLAFDGDKCVGYGHLDPEGDNVWLGIVVSELYQGKGVSRAIMDKLINSAKLNRVGTVSLTVDTDNAKAISLYEKYKFKRISATSTYYLYQLNIE